MTPTTRSATAPETDAVVIPANMLPKTQNVVATFNLGCRTTPAQIAKHARNTEYNPKRFAACIMRIREPKTTALIFGSGKVVVTGAKSPEDSRLACRKFARHIQKIGYTCGMREYKIQNMVCSTDVGFRLRLEGIQRGHYQFVGYEPEIFPGACWRMISPRAVHLIFTSGKVVTTGCKSADEVHAAFAKLYPVLLDFPAPR